MFTSIQFLPHSHSRTHLLFKNLYETPTQDFETLQLFSNKRKRDYSQSSLYQYERQNNLKMATPMEIKGETSMAMDIEILMSKLTLLEKTLSNTTDITIDDNDSATTSTTSTTISSVPDFNDRRLEVRDLRLANAILSLDEDIPENIDESIRGLLTASSVPNGALAHMEYLTSEHYQEYKQQLAAKKATEKKLPRSKGGRRSTQNQTTVTSELWETPATTLLSSHHLHDNSSLSTKAKTEIKCAHYPSTLRSEPSDSQFCSHVDIHQE